MRRTGETDGSPFEESFDYVIVGSGAAGATAARVLADTGRSVAVLEEGPSVEPALFHDRAFDSFQKMFRDMGGQVARGRAFIPVIQGRCLGGSTVVNSAIVWRLPDDVYEPWAKEYGLGQALPIKELHRHWDRLEKELSVTTTPATLGEFNRLMEQGARKLGARAAPTQRYTKDCQGSMRCLTGCPNNAKQSMLISYLPYAEKRGAALITGAKVSRVVMKGDRAASVTGRFTGGERGRFTLHARRSVLLAASAIQTPGILARSGVGSVHLGEHFQGHPGCPIMGLFDHEVNMWKGATQGYDADHHRKEGRYKIETIGLPPEIVFTRMPGVGKRWVQSMAETPHAAIFAVQMRARAHGSVRDRFFGTDIKFTPNVQDMVSMRRGLRFAAELLFAAGARQVLPGIHGLPERLSSADELHLLERGPEDPACYSWIVSHLFGTARMSLRGCDGVIGPDFNVHGAKGLRVLDSSLFPTNIGVNPQHAIMAVAMHGAEKIAAEAS